MTGAGHGDDLQRKTSIEDIPNEEGLRTPGGNFSLPPIPRSPEYVFKDRSQSTTQDFTPFNAARGTVKDPGVVLSDKLVVSENVQHKVRFF